MLIWEIHFIIKRELRIVSMKSKLYYVIMQGSGRSKRSFILPLLDENISKIENSKYAHGYVTYFTPLISVYVCFNMCPSNVILLLLFFNEFACY